MPCSFFTVSRCAFSVTRFALNGLFFVVFFSSITNLIRKRCKVTRILKTENALAFSVEVTGLSSQLSVSNPAIKVPINSKPGEATTKGN